MNTRNRFGAIAVVAMNDLQVALDVCFIEQATAQIEFDADCFRHGVRELVRIAQRAHQFADTEEHVETFFCLAAFTVGAIE